MSLPVLGYRCWRVLSLNKLGNPVFSDPNHHTHERGQPGEPYGLYSVATGIPWNPGTWTKATRCFINVGQPHMRHSPWPLCSCGLYSFASLTNAHGWMVSTTVGEAFLSPMILGLTLNWGRVVPHGQHSIGIIGQPFHRIEGFRARYSRPAAFVRPDWEEQSAVEWLAKKSGAPMLHGHQELANIGQQLIDQGLARDPQTLGFPSTIPRVQEPF